MKVVSKLITILWIMIGLVLTSIFVAALTVSLTIVATDNSRSVLYGAKVGLYVLLIKGLSSLCNKLPLVLKPNKTST